MYASETWKLTEKIINTVQVFICRCLCKILSISWPERISNDELWKRTEQEPISTQLKRRKCKSLGRTLRRDKTCIPKQSLYWKQINIAREEDPRTHGDEARTKKYRTTVWTGAGGSCCTRQTRMATFWSVAFAPLGAKRLKSSQENAVGNKWRRKKLVPWGTDGRLPLSGDFRSLIVE